MPQERRPRDPAPIEESGDGGCLLGQGIAEALRAVAIPVARQIDEEPTLPCQGWVAGRRDVAARRPAQAVEKDERRVAAR